MRISRARAIDRVERAIKETRPEFKSAAWDSAWRGIRALEARNMGDDVRIAEELKVKMKKATE